MKYQDLLQLLNDPETLNRIRQELERRQTVLIEMALSGRIADATDRANILLYFRDGHLPGRPTAIEDVLKNFASSALSYAPIRRTLASRIGSNPTAESIGRALAAEFSDNRFLSDASWAPAEMTLLSIQTATRLGLTADMLGGKTLHSRILGVLHDGARKLEKFGDPGSAGFYEEAEKHLTNPDVAWQHLENFAAGVRQVGPALTADFMKNIGFHMFVKPDFHFLRQFPKLAEVDTAYSPRDSFILGWELAALLRIPAFVLDHTLYQWGRHGDKGTGTTTPEGRQDSIATKPQPAPAAQPVAVAPAGVTISSRVLDSLLQIPKWREECTKITVHRQEQLKKILAKYDHRSLPISHFTKQHLNDPKVRNADAYPAVCALLCGILERSGESLRLKPGIVLGERLLP